MSRRRLVLSSLLAGLWLLCTAPAASAFGPLWAQPADGGARLAASGGGATVVWAEHHAGGASLMAQRYDRGGLALLPAPVTLASGLGDLTHWLVASGGGQETLVAWKAGGVTWLLRTPLDAAPSFGPVALCTDAAVAAGRGAGAAAAPAQIVSDGAGGAYVRLEASPSSAAGDTLLNHVSAAGTPAAADPGLAVSDGTVGAMAADAGGHLVALLTAPGRSGPAVQRYTTQLAAAWPQPVSPYGPGAAPAAAASAVPVGVAADGSAVAAWREGGTVKTQRFSQNGARRWGRPAAVTLSGPVLLADDAHAGCYLAGAGAEGLRVHHVFANGVALSPAGGFRLPLPGVAEPRVDAVSRNRAGDLAVAYSDGAAPGAPGGVARVTFLGAWRRAALAPGPARLADLGGDSAGGAFALGAGPNAQLWRVGVGGLALTLRPRASAVRYGRAVGVAGYLTSEGAPLAGRAVAIRHAGGGGTRTLATATTDAQGFYTAAVSPATSGRLSASAARVPGGPAASTTETIGVRPLVGLSISHTKAAGRLTEHFRGTVTPAHGGSRVVLQRRVGDRWRAVTSGRLDARSRYAISWTLPRRSASYKLRVVLPAHADHLMGVSSTATVRVTVRQL